MLQLGGVLLLLILKTVNSESLSSISVALNDSVTGNLGYICAFTEKSVNEISWIFQSSYILIDVRNLLSSENPLDVSEVTKLAEARMAKVRMQFPASFKVTKLFALVMPEDDSGAYDLAINLKIDVVLAVNHNVTKGISIRLPNPAFALQVFFCSNETLNQIVTIQNANGANELQESPASGLLISFIEPAPLFLGYGILAFLILKVCSLLSITVASFIVFKNHKEILETIKKMKPESKMHPALKILFLCCFILCSITTILLAFFFFDIMVYFFISMFVIVGAVSMSNIFSIALFSRIPTLKSLEFILCKKKINVLKCVFFFVFLSFTITWCVFRNNPQIGWIMQNIIGFFIIVNVLLDIVVLLSFKTICGGFLLFVIYDVFFVFITPFFMQLSNDSLTSSTLLSSNAHEVLARNRRSASASIMEAVATGSAGTLGEKMPLVFKVSTYMFMPYGASVCLPNQEYVLLGFGDAILPGALCVFLAFYDACWKRKLPYNCFASLLGYCIGGVVVSSVLFSSKMAQPALLYLCPFTLGVTVIFAFLRGGKAELTSLWNDHRPTPPLLNNDEVEKTHYSIETENPVSFAKPEGEIPSSAVQRDRYVVT